MPTVAVFWCVGESHGSHIVGLATSNPCNDKARAGRQQPVVDPLLPLVACNTANHKSYVVRSAFPQLYLPLVE